MTTYRNSLFATIAGLGLMLGVAMPASAAATYSSCVGTGFDISGKVSVATDCSISSADQDFLNTNPITVNEGDGFFGFTDWVFGGKIGVDAGYNGDAGGQSGAFDLSAVVDAALQDVMLVFKDGAGTTLVGYLINDEIGTWNSPFTEPPFDFNGASPKDVSHISVYTRGGTPVPAPAALGLLGLGLMGVGIAARRRRS